MKLLRTFAARRTVENQALYRLNIRPASVVAPSDRSYQHMVQNSVQRGRMGERERERAC